MAQDDELERTEIEALLETRRELGPRYDAELVDGFADRVERAVRTRTETQAAARYLTDQAHASAGKRQLALGIVSVVAGVPISAITLAVPEGDGFASLCVAWLGIVGVNVAHAVQFRLR